jgi:hypothetical protein
LDRRGGRGEPFCAVATRWLPGKSGSQHIYAGSRKMFPCRTLHLRFNDLDDPQPIPRATDYASVFESDVPLIVQHTRLDSRRAEVALLSTVAYPQD